METNEPRGTTYGASKDSYKTNSRKKKSNRPKKFCTNRVSHRKRAEQKSEVNKFHSSSISDEIYCNEDMISDQVKDSITGMKGKHESLNHQQLPDEIAELQWETNNPPNIDVHLTATFKEILRRWNRVNTQKRQSQLEEADCSRVAKTIQKEQDITSKSEDTVEQMPENTGGKHFQNNREQYEEDHQADVESKRQKSKRKALKKARQRNERFVNVLNKARALDQQSAAFDHWRQVCELIKKKKMAVQPEHKEEDENHPVGGKHQEDSPFQHKQSVPKRQDKRARRRERWLKEQEEISKKRSKFWEAETQQEMDIARMVVSLLVAETARRASSKLQRIVTREEIEMTHEATKRIKEEAKAAYRFIYRADLKSRFQVVGLNASLNGRNGTVRCWDELKKKFRVGLDTRKGKNVQEINLKPVNMNFDVPEIPFKKLTADPEYVVTIPCIFEGTTLTYGVSKSIIEQMRSARSHDLFIECLMNERGEEEERVRMEEEKEHMREEEKQKARAEKVREENEEWERVKEFEKEMKEVREADRREYRRRHRRGRRGLHHGPFCDCPECILWRVFFCSSFRGEGSSDYKFSEGSGGPKAFNFERDFDDDDDDDYGEYRHDEEKDLKLQMESAANVLGIEVNAASGDIKSAFRKKALLYHPDKFRPEKHNGMTREEAEEHFKDIVNAYEILRS